MKKKGFTLIELLVVIAIIGLLSTLSVLALNSARSRARDAKRMSDIKQINTAIQMYINANGHSPDFGNAACYNPQVADGACCTNDFGGGSCGYVWADLQTQLQAYLPELPVDPCGAKCWRLQDDLFYTYTYKSPAGLVYKGVPLSATDYEIKALHLEKDNSSIFFGLDSF